MFISNVGWCYISQAFNIKIFVNFVKWIGTFSIIFPFSGTVLSPRPWETESAAGSDLMSRSVTVLGTRHRRLITGILSRRRLAGA